MKNWISLACILVLYSCQTVKIQNTNYTTNSSKVELGIIGHSQGFFFDKEFNSKAYPELVSKIKVNVSVVPFSKRSNKIYQSKTKNNQNFSKINYVDSLHIKPELVTISFLDSNNFCREINSPENTEIKRLIKETKKVKVISSIAIVLKEEELQKIKTADEFYLINKKDQKYSLGLFKQGKQTDVLEISSAPVLGYQESIFCWSESKPGKWDIVDLVPSCQSCKGNTEKKVSNKKKNKSLFKM